MHKVTIYTTSSCVYCKMAKSFFKENNILYEEKDIAFDHQTQEEMIKKSGQLGVPVIDIDGQIVVGFDKEKISSLIGIK